MLNNRQDFLKSAASDKITLAHIYPAKRIKVFDLVDTNTYTKTMDYIVDSVKLTDGTYLTYSDEDTLNDGEWSFDLDTMLLTVKKSSLNLNDGLIIFFKLFFATKPLFESYDLTLAGKKVEYDGRITSIPQLKTQLNTESVVLTSGGNLTLENIDGHFLGAYQGFIWEGKLVEIFSWNDELEIDQAALIYRGYITGRNFNEKTFGLDVKDLQHSLEELIDLENYTVEDGVLPEDTARFNRTIYGINKGVKCQPLDPVIEADGVLVDNQSTVPTGALQMYRYTSLGQEGLSGVILSQVHNRFFTEDGITDVNEWQEKKDIPGVFRGYNFKRNEVKAIWIGTDRYVARNYQWTNYLGTKSTVTFFKHELTNADLPMPSPGHRVYYMFRKTTYGANANAIKTEFNADPDRNKEGVFLIPIFNDGNYYSVFTSTRQTYRDDCYLPDEVRIELENAPKTFPELGKAYRQYRISNHPLSEFYTGVISQPSQDYLIVADSSGLRVNDTIWIKNNKYVIRNIYGKNIFGYTPFPSGLIGSQVIRYGVSKVYVDGVYVDESHIVKKGLVDNNYEFTLNNKVEVLISPKKEIGVLKWNLGKAYIQGRSINTTTGAVLVENYSYSTYASQYDGYDAVLSIKIYNYQGLTNSFDLEKFQEQLNDWFAPGNLVSPINQSRDYMRVIKTEVLENKAVIAGATSDTTYNKTFIIMLERIIKEEDIPAWATENWAYQDKSFFIIDDVKEIDSESVVCVDCYGKTDTNETGGKLLLTGPEIIKDLFKNNIFIQDFIDEESFAEATIEAPYPISLPLPQEQGSTTQPKLKDIVAKICKTIKASLYITSDQKIGIKVLNTSRDENLPVIEDADVTNWSVSTKSGQLYTEAQVKYDQRDFNVENGYQFQTLKIANPFSKEYETTSNSISLEMVSGDYNSVQEVVERVLFGGIVAETVVTVKSSFALMDYSVGDQVILDLKGMYKDPRGNERMIGMVIGVTRNDQGSTLMISDLGNLFNRVGVISPDDTPDWSSSEDNEKEKASFITDENGLVDDDETTEDQNQIG